MTKNRMLTMTPKEVKRCEILKMADKQKITQKTGARRIGVSEQHFRRLLRGFRRDGPSVIISGHRSKPSSNRTGSQKRQAINR